MINEYSCLTWHRLKSKMEKFKSYSWANPICYGHFCSWNWWCNSTEDYWFKLQNSGVDFIKSVNLRISCRGKTLKNYASLIWYFFIVLLSLLCFDMNFWNNICVLLWNENNTFYFPQLNMLFSGKVKFSNFW